MKGTSHLILTTSLGYFVAEWLFHDAMHSLGGMILFIMFMVFVAVGSIAPDADIKHSLIRSFAFRWFFLPYWILALVPLSFIYDRSDEKILSRISMAMFKPKHRGVMHSLVGMMWSGAVVYIVTMYVANYVHVSGHHIALTIVYGFSFGYVMHLIEDAMFTKTAIKPLVIEKYKIGG